MKLLTILMGASMMLLVSCGTTYTTTTAYPAYDVPEAVRTSFMNQYPAAVSVTWTTEEQVPVLMQRQFLGWPSLDDDEYVVRFTMNGMDHYAWYDDDGNWIGTVSPVINYATLLVAMNNRINTEYPGYTTSFVNRVYRGNQMVYEVRLQNNNIANLLLDASGNVLRRNIDTVY